MSEIGKKISGPAPLSGAALRALINCLVDGLVYISETDSPIEVISAGEMFSITIRDVLDELKDDGPERPVQEIEFDTFFEKLVRHREWHGPDEIRRRERFALLRDLLKDNLRDIHVYRVGDVQIDIYVVGIDADGRLAGVKTKAVET